VYIIVLIGCVRIDYNTHRLQTMKIKANARDIRIRFGHAIRRIREARPEGLTGALPL
jgi:hypothetical protein